jgi:hypothetical protein
LWLRQIIYVAFVKKKLRRRLCHLP